MAESVGDGSWRRALLYNTTGQPGSRETKKNSWMGSKTWYVLTICVLHFTYLAVQVMLEITISLECLLPNYASATTTVYCKISGLCVPPGARSFKATHRS